MKTTTIGKLAEDKAAAYLVRQGYTILQQNWRTRWCEIDIVAKKGHSLLFVEVKYRRRSSWGRGLDYITVLKQRQMAFAAEFWVAAHRSHYAYSLAAIEVAGPSFEITEFIPEIL